MKELATAELSMISGGMGWPSGLLRTYVKADNADKVWQHVKKHFELNPRMDLAVVDLDY